MRESDYPTTPPLAALLPLPPDAPRPPATPAAARSAWSSLLGGRPVLLVADVELARALLLRAAGVPRGTVVGVPANATDGLVGALKDHGARPRFLPLDHALQPVPATTGDASEPFCLEPSPGSIPAPSPGRSPLWVDHPSSLPAPGHGHHWPEPVIDLWPLHLTEDQAEAGALLAFPPDTAGSALRDTVARLLGPSGGPDPAAAVAQWQRWFGEPKTGLAGRQAANAAALSRGLREAAGLRLLPSATGAALRHGIALEIPAEVHPATFFAYVARENTPVRWLAMERPVHHAALRGADRPAAVATAELLARWLLIPVGPDDRETEIGHAVLGVVKAAEYLGVRFRADPARAASYAALLDEQYGPDHDAYRPAFPLPTPPSPPQAPSFPAHPTATYSTLQND